jgi:hypothetical protein
MSSSSTLSAPPRSLRRVFQDDAEFFELLPHLVRLLEVAHATRLLPRVEQRLLLG